MAWSVLTAPVEAGTFIKTSIPVHSFPMHFSWQFFFAAFPMAICGLVSGICQGRTAVSAIHMTAKQPDSSGKGITMTALVETYAILALLTSILLIYGISL